MSVEVVQKLTPNPDGATRNFFTPSRYEPGSLRLIWNGQTYEPNDTKFGWSEVGDTEIELVTAPRTGDVLSAFYTDKDATGAGEGVKGSPFHPTDLYP